MLVNQLPVYLTLSEVHRMLAACEEERDRMLITLLWVTGCRVSEVIAIRAGDITQNGIRCLNLKQGYWRKLPNGIREHVAVPTEKHVFVSPDMLREIRQWAAGLHAEDPLVGRLADGQPLSRKTAWYIVKRAAAKAGILKRRFSSGELTPAWTHTLRHSAATNLLTQGAPVTLVQSQLGHASLASTQVYTQLADPHKEAIIAQVKF